MKKGTLILLTVLFFAMAALLPWAVPSGAVTQAAESRYMETIPLDDEYAFLND